MSRKTTMTFSAEQKKLVADYFVQIGVAWFAAGVIGLFLGSPHTLREIFSSLFWGIALSLLFLGSGIFAVRSIRDHI